MRPGRGRIRTDMKPLSEDIDWSMVAAAREPHPERLHAVEDERRAERRERDARYYRTHKERILERTRAWKAANREAVRANDRARAARHRAERNAASRRWQAKFKAEHGISYSAWRRRRLRETAPQAAASAPKTAAAARKPAESGQSAADSSIRSVSAASAAFHGSGRRL